MARTSVSACRNSFGDTPARPVATLGDNTLAIDKLAVLTGIGAVSGGRHVLTVFGDAGDDSLYGGNDTDSLTGGTGNDRIDGGNGNDIAIYGGNQADHVFGTAGAFLAIADASGIDRLLDVETLRFADGPTSIFVSDSKAISAPGGGRGLVLAGDSDNRILASGLGDVMLGNGGADDVILYTVEMKFDRVLPVWRMLGQPQETTLRETTVLRNQPFAVRVASGAARRSCFQRTSCASLPCSRCRSASREAASAALSALPSTLCGAAGSAGLCSGLAAGLADGFGSAWPPWGSAAPTGRASPASNATHHTPALRPLFAPDGGTLHIAPITAPTPGD